MFSKRLFVVPAALALVAGCGLFGGTDSRTYGLQAGPRTPAAVGQIKVTPTDTANQELRVEVRHVPVPQDLERGASTYVVWAIPTDIERPINLGELVIDEDREGNLRTVTPHPSFDVMVTAESTPTPETPSDTILLRGSVPPG